jgi:hypothetical protein
LYVYGSEEVLSNWVVTLPVRTVTFFVMVVAGEAASASSLIPAEHGDLLDTGGCMLLPLHLR